MTRNEDLSTLGVLWESSIFPHRAPEGMVLLRVMLGGMRRPEVSAFDDREVADLAVKEAARVLGISAHPLRQWVTRVPAAIAQYTVGHDRRIAEIRRLAAAHQGLHLCGTAYDGVSGLVAAAYEHPPKSKEQGDRGYERTQQITEA